MGKDHKVNKTTKQNVFKVAGCRSFKAKNKAKAVSTQLKKLNEVKRKLADVDQQLNSLQEEVRQQPLKSTEKADEKIGRLGSSEIIRQYEENEQKSAEALEKLTDMSM